MLTGEDRALHVAAIEAIKPTGMALEVAAREFAAAWAALKATAFWTLRGTMSAPSCAACPSAP
jgi:hypothetical protein